MWSANLRIGWLQPLSRRDVLYQEEVGLFEYLHENKSVPSVAVQEGASANIDINNDLPWAIWYRDENNQVVVDKSPGSYLPTWQTSPVFFDGRESNENILRSNRTSSQAAQLGDVQKRGKGVFKSPNI